MNKGFQIHLYHALCKIMRIQCQFYRKFKINFLQGSANLKQKNLIKSLSSTKKKTNAFLRCKIQNFQKESSLPCMIDLTCQSKRKRKKPFSRLSVNLL